MCAAGKGDINGTLQAGVISMVLSRVRQTDLARVFYVPTGGSVLYGDSDWASERLLFYKTQNMFLI